MASLKTFGKLGVGRIITDDCKLIKRMFTHSIASDWNRFHGEEKVNVFIFSLNNIILKSEKL